MKASVLFLLPYPLHRAPSQRFRVEAFFEVLKESGVSYRSHQFLDDKAWQVLYKQGSSFQKSWAVIKGFFSRLFVVFFTAPTYQHIFIHREAAPIGPPVFEWILAKIFRKKIIYDFDDAIWVPNVSENNRLAATVKCFWKIKYVCKWSYKVSAGNAFLADWARQFNSNVIILPTCVDMEKKYGRPKEVSSKKKTIIGWTGSHSTLKYLNLIYPVLKSLETEFIFDFLVICDSKPSFLLDSLRFIKWKEETEIEDLLKIDIGIMPLVEDSWSNGKCGFKLIQYLALGIPSVASPVGVNKEIIEPGVNGFLCDKEQDWLKAFRILLTDSNLRERMGNKGLEKMKSTYSLQVHTPVFLALFKSKS